MIKIDYSKTDNCLSSADIEAQAPSAMQALSTLHAKSGKGSDFLGWLNLPSSITKAQITAINDAAKRLRNMSDAVIVVGIGGSYLGAKAVIEALLPTFFNGASLQDHLPMAFAGHNLCEDYLAELMSDAKRSRSFSPTCIVISKSGTTTEPAIAFRLIKEYFEELYGKEDATQRIVAITDGRRGALRTMADKEGYQTFVIPDDVGGRFSVLTPVGLLPIACKGIDIAELINGAVDAQRAFAHAPFEQNPAAQYAALRNALYKKGKKVEILANSNPKLHSLGEWWKQLYGESEGKDSKGIFPASADFTTDLHSLGQYIQSGERSIFETFISIDKPQHTLAIPRTADDADGLNYIAGKRISDVNNKAMLGTQMAHYDGGVPVISIGIPTLSIYELGYLIYFFEIACGISGYMLGVNPFDQPGVEAYKKNMFALLGKE